MQAKPERLQKILAAAGIASRRKAEALIASGSVSVNGHTVTELGTKADPRMDEIRVDGKLLRGPERHVYLAMYKPKGHMTTVSDPEGRPTVMDLLKGVEQRVFPVGRLDYMSEGLLLLTNDGELKRAMELPSSGLPRTYRARTFGAITQAQLEGLMEGIEIDGMHYGRIDANMERSAGRNQWIEVTITEGKNREVRRVLEHLGLEVSRLIRTAYGPFELLDLPRAAASEAVLSPHDLLVADRIYLGNSVRGLIPAKLMELGQEQGQRRQPAHASAGS